MQLYYSAILPLCGYAVCCLFIKLACGAEVTGNSHRLPFLNLRLAGFEGGGNGMPIPAFDGLGEGIIFR
jgi:hypothetical protein